DLVGNLTGAGSVLGGGSSGAIGSQLPQGTPPLAPLGDAVVGVLNTVAGNGQSPLSGSGLGAVLDSLPGAAAPSASAPASTSGGTTNTLSGPVGGALTPVTQALGGVPVLGGLLSGR